MLKIVTSTNDSLNGVVLQKKNLNEGDVIRIKTPDGRRKIFKIEFVKKTKDGYTIKDSNTTLILKNE